MKENYDEMVRKYKGRPLTPKEVKELCVNSVKRVRPFLDKLGQWRRESLDSKFIFGRAIGSLA